MTLVIVPLSTKKGSLVVISPIDMLEISVELDCAKPYDGLTKRKETPPIDKIKNVIRNIEGFVCFNIEKFISMF